MKRLMTVAVLCCMLLGAAAGQAQEKVTEVHDLGECPGC